MPKEDLKPSADFFVAVLKALGTIYPNRMCAKAMEEMLEPMGKLESLYRSLPMDESAPRAKERA